jgi:Ni/Fe-hydrogenase subunit HybB-like protein
MPPVVTSNEPALAELWAFLRHELRPRGRWITAFNVITAAIMLASVFILFIRFTRGLGPVTNLSQEFPWGLSKGFNVVTGVAFAGGAYVLCFLAYIMRLEKYHPVVRVTVLNGFLAYSCYAVALLLDLGRPWHMLNPIIGYSFGVTSVLFLICWHFLLYVIAQFVEFSPAIAEWLGVRRIRRILGGLTIGAVVFGIMLSTLHQSALGALFLMAETKIHPLWYSELIPLLFFVSSIFAGLSIVIVQGGVLRRYFAHRAGEEFREGYEEISFGLARIAAGAMFVYLSLQMLAFVHGQRWNDFSGGWAAWFTLEVVGLVTVPMMMLLAGSAGRRIRLVQAGAVLTLIGIVMNRMNVSVIAYNWQAPVHYVPSWMEWIVTAGVIAAQLWVFRWVIERMPVLGFEPAWARAMDDHAAGEATFETRRAAALPHITTRG